MSQNHKFNIISWSAWAPSLDAPSDWQSWQGDLQPLLARDTHCKGREIPAMTRRRCSELTRMALQTSIEATENHDVDYAVFASQHGELDCALKLMTDIINSELLSPTRFVQSVHNTSAGLFSILKKLNSNVTSIAAGQQTFLMALLDACAWMNLHPEKTVLLTVFDDFTPTVYDSLKVESNYRYAVALLLNANKFGSNLVLDINPELALQPSSRIPQALSFLNWYLTNKTNEFMLNTSNQSYCLQRAA